MKIGRLGTNFYWGEPWGLARYRGNDWWALYLGRLWIYWWPSWDRELPGTHRCGK